MQNPSKPSFETLKAAESGRRLVSQSGRHEVAAKVLTDADGDEYLVLRLWIGSHPGPSATAGWSEPSAWQHIVVDDDLNVVATGWGKRERDSFAMTERALATKGITAAKRRADTPGSHSKFVWEPDDVDVLTPSQAAEALGFDPIEVGGAERLDDKPSTSASRRARTVALDASLSLEERLQRIDEIADGEARRLGVNDMPGIRRYAETAAMAWNAAQDETQRKQNSGALPSIDATETPGLTVLKQATIRVATRLERRSLEDGLVSINEQRHLDPEVRRTLNDVVKDLGAPATLLKFAVATDEWPKLGTADIALRWPDGGTTIAELKCGASADALAPCAWDAAKSAYLLQRGTAFEAYLLAGTTAESWESQSARGAEFFATREHDGRGLRVGYEKWWKKWEQDGYPAASRMPARFVTEFITEASFMVGDVPWLVRLARVKSAGDKWIEWPPLLGGGG